jgi:hypothetical protein
VRRPHWSSVDDNIDGLSHIVTLFVDGGHLEKAIAEIINGGVIIEID